MRISRSKSSLTFLGLYREWSKAVGTERAQHALASLPSHSDPANECSRDVTPIDKCKRKCKIRSDVRSIADPLELCGSR